MFPSGPKLRKLKVAGILLFNHDEGKHSSGIGELPWREEKNEINF